MFKVVKELSAIEVSRLNQPGLHNVGGVPGLALQIGNAGSRSWVLRLYVAGKRREAGLGGYPAVPLVDARRRARELREQADRGEDPIDARRLAHAKLRADLARQVTFAQASAAYIKDNSAGWKSAKHAQQWVTTLETYCDPINGLLVRELTAEHVLQCIGPIWATKSETASRLRGRIETVLDFSATRGWRSGENVARWRGHIEHALPARNKIAPTVHHKALGVAEIGDFMVKVRKLDGVSARALELLTLCASRSGEVRLATWSEFDLDAALWTVPSVRMKAAKEHRVPLSEQAVQLLRDLPRVEGVDHLFTFRGRPISDMAMTLTMRRLGANGVPHGMRSTFRDWVSERTSYVGELAEMALAHTVGSKVEAAYRRGDMFDKRRRLMQDWAQFLSERDGSSAKVVPITAKAA